MAAATTTKRTIRVLSHGAGRACAASEDLPSETLQVVPFGPSRASQRPVGQRERLLVTFLVNIDIDKGSWRGEGEEEDDDLHGRIRSSCALRSPSAAGVVLISASFHVPRGSSSLCFEFCVFVLLDQMKSESFGHPSSLILCDQTQRIKGMKDHHHHHHHLISIPLPFSDHPSSLILCDQTQRIRGRARGPNQPIRERSSLM